MLEALRISNVSIYLYMLSKDVTEKTLSQTDSAAESVKKNTYSESANTESKMVSETD